MNRKISHLILKFLNFVYNNLKDLYGSQQKILQNTPDFRALTFYAQTDLHTEKKNYSMFKRKSVSELPR